MKLNVTSRKERMIYAQMMRRTAAEREEKMSAGEFFTLAQRMAWTVRFSGLKKVEFAKSLGIAIRKILAMDEQDLQRVAAYIRALEAKDDRGAPMKIYRNTKNILHLTAVSAMIIKTRKGCAHDAEEEKPDFKKCGRRFSFSDSVFTI